MGMSEVVMLDMMGHMVVLGTALDIGVCRWAKFSHLQHTVYEAGSQVGNICSRPVKSTVDYIMVRQEDKAKIRNVKVITSDLSNFLRLVLAHSANYIILTFAFVWLGHEISQPQG